MRYGYFDEQNREYVITRPDTPAPWANYLGSPEYGAIISNNAGGYSFVKSGAKGRIIRYIFNHRDKPGRYIYLRDDADGDYWSASWQPVGKPLDTYKTECRHGTAYTVMNTDYRNINAETTYYVPLDKKYEVWRLKLTNNSDTERRISAFGFVEFTSESYYDNDLVNLQYTMFITKTYFEGNMIVQTVNENISKGFNGSNDEERFFGVVGAPVKSYNGDKAAFIGAYHDYCNPVAVERGECDNALNYNMNACGALQSQFVLQPGETKEIAYILGKNDRADAAKILNSYSDLSTVDKELSELKNFWHSKLDNLIVNTPDEAFNCMVNTWNAYQCFITFIWSRAASLIYCGQRNGYGYRDTVQDIQGIIHLAPEEAADKLRFMISAQVDNGGGLPLVKFDHNPGHEGTPDDAEYVKETGHPAYRADDALWLFPTVWKYIAETGNTGFLDEVIPYSNKGEGSVYEHLKRAIDFSMNRLGDHGMPAGLHADWNDCLRLGKKGESSFVAMQLYYAMEILLKFAEYKNDSEYMGYLKEIKDKLYNIIQKDCWEDDRFLRGYTEKGQVIGSKHDKEASMWLNPQTWSVISGIASKEQAETAMNSVYNLLNTKYGAQVMAPPYENFAFDGALALLFNPSTKENGGIFSQTQGWLILAEALLGHGDRAFEYFKETSPASHNDNAEIRVLEPYVHGQFTESVKSPFEGRSHVHWLTGTASTVMVGCVEGILGLRPDMKGLTISPAIPTDWKELSIVKVFRGKKLNIKIQNPDGKESEVTRLTVNGQLMEGNYIPEELLTDNSEITVIM